MVFTRYTSWKKKSFLPLPPFFSQASFLPLFCFDDIFPTGIEEKKAVSTFFGCCFFVFVLFFLPLPLCFLSLSSFYCCCRRHRCCHQLHTMHCTTLPPPVFHGFQMSGSHSLAAHIFGIGYMLCYVYAYVRYTGWLRWRGKKAFPMMMLC